MNNLNKLDELKNLIKQTQFGTLYLKDNSIYEVLYRPEFKIELINYNLLGCQELIDIATNHNNIFNVEHYNNKAFIGLNVEYNEKSIKTIIYDCKEIAFASEDDALQSKIKELNISYDEIKKQNTYKVQKFWATNHEIKLYDLLFNSGYNPLARKDSIEGPDFYVDKICYIECVTPTLGNKIIEKITNGFSNYKDYRERLTNSLAEKLKKFNKYSNSTSIQNFDKTKPYIISLSLGMLSVDLPNFLAIELLEEICYGAGDIKWHFDSQNWEFLGETRAFTNYFDTRKDERVVSIDENIFNKKEYENIAGVLFSSDLAYDKYCIGKTCLYLNPKNIHYAELENLINIVICKPIKQGLNQYIYLYNGEPFDYKKNIDNIFS